MANVNFNFTNRQGYGPINANLPPVDFNPAPQPNPIDAALGGYERGQSLGLRAQQMEALNQQRELEKQKLEQEKADKSIAYLTDSKFAKYLSKETKLRLFKDNVVPLLNSKYGLNIDPSAVDHDGGEDGNIENLLNLVKNGATPDIIQHEYQQAVLKSDPEQLPILKEFGDTLKKSDKNFYFVDPSTKEMFDPSLQPISEAPQNAAPRMLTNPGNSNEGVRRNALVTSAINSVKVAKNNLNPKVLDEIKGIKFTPGKVYQQLASPEAKRFYRNLSNAISSELYLKTGAAATQGEVDQRAILYMPAANDSVDDMNERLDMLNSEATNFGNPESNVSNKSSGEDQQKGLAVGTIKKGYRYKGGDPANPSNWEKQ